MVALPELVDRLLLAMTHMWNSGTVVTDWKNAVMNPIPKEGDLGIFYSWRGISLLDMAGNSLHGLSKRTADQ